MPSVLTQMVMCLHMVNMCAAFCWTFGIHRRGEVYATARSMFVVCRCVLMRCFEFYRLVTMPSLVDSDRICYDWNKKYRQAPDHCHDKSIHTIIFGFAIDARDY
jgi:hypothetical protein